MENYIGNTLFEAFAAKGWERLEGEGSFNDMRGAMLSLYTADMVLGYADDTWKIEVTFFTDDETTCKLSTTNHDQIMTMVMNDSINNAFRAAVDNPIVEQAIEDGELENLERLCADVADAWNFKLVFETIEPDETRFLEKRGFRILTDSDWEEYPGAKAGTLIKRLEKSEFIAFAEAGDAQSVEVTNSFCGWTFGLEWYMQTFIEKDPLWIVEIVLSDDSVTASLDNFCRMIMANDYTVEQAQASADYKYIRGVLSRTAKQFGAKLICEGGHDMPY